MFQGPPPTASHAPLTTGLNFSLSRRYGPTIVPWDLGAESPYTYSVYLVYRGIQVYRSTGVQVYRYTVSVYHKYTVRKPYTVYSLQGRQSIQVVYSHYHGTRYTVVYRSTAIPLLTQRWLHAIQCVTNNGCLNRRLFL